MTVAAADILKYSPYEVKDGGAFTTSLFTTYKTVAGLLLDKMVPDDLDGATYDWCHALLICHLYALKLGNIEIRSTSPNEWEFVQPGITGYYLQVKEILKQFETALAEEVLELPEEGDAKRCDADMPEMHLDQADVPYYRDDT